MQEQLAPATVLVSLSEMRAQAAPARSYRHPPAVRPQFAQPTPTTQTTPQAPYRSPCTSFSSSSFSSSSTTGPWLKYDMTGSSHHHCKGIRCQSPQQIWLFEPYLVIDKFTWTLWECQGTRPPPNYTLRYPRYHLLNPLDTISSSMEVHGSFQESLARI